MNPHLLPNRDREGAVPPSAIRPAQALTEPRPQGSGAFRVVTDAQIPDNLTPQRSLPPQRSPVLTLISSSLRLRVSAVKTP